MKGQLLVQNARGWKLMAKAVCSGASLAEAIPLAQDECDEPLLRPVFSDIVVLMEKIARGEIAELPLDWSKDSIPRSVLWLSFTGWMTGMLDHHWDLAAQLCLERSLFAVEASESRERTRRQFHLTSHFGTLLQAGVPIGSLIDSVADDLNFIELQPFFNQLKMEVFAGRSMVPVFERSLVFQPEFTAQVALGEQHGDLGERLAVFAQKMSAELGYDMKSRLPLLSEDTQMRIKFYSTFAKALEQSSLAEAVAAALSEIPQSGLKKTWEAILSRVSTESPLGLLMLRTEFQAHISNRERLFFSVGESSGNLPQCLNSLCETYL